MTIAGVKAFTPSGTFDQHLNDASSDLGGPVVGAATSTSLGGRAHDAFVLSVIALVQLSWLALLGYGLVSVLTHSGHG